MCLFLNRHNPEMELHYLLSWKALLPSSPSRPWTGEHMQDIPHRHTPRSTECRWIGAPPPLPPSQTKEQSRGSVVFSFFSWDTVWLSKDQSSAREEPSGSNSLTKRLSCPKFLTFRPSERPHPTHRADSCFPKHPKEFTLMAVGFTSWRGGTCVPPPFSCAFVLKTPGNGEWHVRTGLRFLFLKVLIKSFLKPFLFFLNEKYLNN